MAGLWIVALDGVPVIQLVDFGTLDSSGQRLVTCPVPPGVAGHVLGLEAWSVGFSGRVSDSQIAELALQ